MYQETPCVDAQMPVVSVMSSDDTTATKQRKLLREEGHKVVEYTGCSGDHKMQRPTFLPIHFIDEEIDITVPDSRSNAVDAQKSTNTVAMKPFLKSVISPLSGLSHVTDQGNDIGLSLHTLSDVECSRTSAVQDLSLMLLTEKADSDPSDNSKIGKNSLKVSKSTSMPSEKNRNIINSKEVDIDGASYGYNREKFRKDGRIKRKKPKYNTREKFAKMTKMFSDRQVYWLIKCVPRCFRRKFRRFRFGPSLITFHFGCIFGNSWYHFVSGVASIFSSRSFVSYHHRADLEQIARRRIALKDEFERFSRRRYLGKRWTTGRIRRSTALYQCIMPYA